MHSLTWIIIQRIQMNFSAVSNMKYIIRLFVGMVVFLAATSCHTSEIDNPDNTKPNGQPSDSELSITASIIQTRVTYSDSGDKLNQQWAVGDVLFGYIGGEAKEENRVSFTVSSVDPTTHIATLDAGSYKSTLLSSVDKVVDLVYTGQEQPYQADGSVNVTMSSQSANGKIPACMHSRATVTKENNVISLKFKFYNDCAIFEIVSLTGVNEENLSGSLQLTSIEATNLYQEGKYTLGENGFEFAGVEERMGNVSLTLGGDWHVNTDGTITDGTTSRALIAVVPIAEDDKKDIKFTSTTNTSQDFSFDYGAHKLDAGVCYVIGAKPVVAKTEDGQYFTSVSAAFDHASTLVSTFGEYNKVTLVNELIYGLNEDDVAHAPTNYDPTIIDINYSVILDLNGCTLSLDCLEDEADDDTFLRPFDSYYGGGFCVWTNGTLTIIDEEDCGYIDSCSECPIIENSGTVNIEGGNLFHWYRHHDNVIYSTGDLNVSGGNLYAFASPAVILDGTDAEGIITGGLIENDNDNGSDVVLTSYETIQVLDGADCTISGGVIHSYGDSPTIGCRSVSPNISSLTITWPTSQDDTKTDKEYGEYIHEPLIYAAAPSTTENPYYGYSNVPISAYYANKSNTAVVSLQGGYLISNQSSNMKAFYAGNNSSANTYNLDYTNFGGFYSNKGMFLKSGSTNATADLSGTNGFLIKTGSPPVRLYATSQSNSGFTMPLIYEDSGDLYYMDNKK